MGGIFLLGQFHEEKKEETPDYPALQSGFVNFIIP